MKPGGFTLVELMVTLVLLGMLVAVVAPMGGGWSKNAHRLMTQNALNEAVGRARGAALRNAMAATGDDPVAAVCVKDQEIYVLEGVTGTAPSCTTNAGNESWRQKINAGVSITQGGADYQCSCFNNHGLLTLSSCNTCSTSSTFVIATGAGANDTDTFVLD